MVSKHKEKWPHSNLEVFVWVIFSKFLRQPAQTCQLVKWQTGMLQQSTSGLLRESIKATLSIPVFLNSSIGRTAHDFLHTIMNDWHLFLRFWHMATWCASCQLPAADRSRSEWRLSTPFLVRLTWMLVKSWTPQIDPSYIAKAAKVRIFELGVGQISWPGVSKREQFIQTSGWRGAAGWDPMSFLGPTVL